MNDSKKGQVQGIGLLVLFIIVIYIINSYQQNNVITITNSELNMDIIKINSNENLTIINKDLTPYRITIDGKNFQVNPNSNYTLKLAIGQYQILSPDSVKIKGKIIVT